MRRYYVHLQGGLGNQLYELSFAYYLRCMNKDVSMFYGGNTIGDTKDKTKRNTQTELVKSLGFNLYHENDYPLSIIRHRKVNKCLPFLVRFWREPPKQHALYLPKKLAKLKSGRFGYFNLVYGNFQHYDYLSLSYTRQIYNALCKLNQNNIFNPGPYDIAIHIRRGDFLASPDTYKIFEIAHYLQGLQLLERERKVGSVYVFSDDFSAITNDLQQISAHYTVIKVEGNSVIGDIVQMAQFERFVLANSTFSWWAAFMAETRRNIRVVVPKQPLMYHNENDKYFPDHWIKI